MLGLIIRYELGLFVIGLMIGIINEAFFSAVGFRWGEVFVAGWMTPIVVTFLFLAAAFATRTLRLVWKAYLKLDRWLDIKE